MIPQGGRSVEQSVRLFEMRRDCPVAEKAPEPLGLLNNDRRRLSSMITGMQFTGDGKLLVFTDGAVVNVLRMPLLQRVAQLAVQAVDHPTAISRLALAQDAHIAAVVAVPVAAAPAEDPKLIHRPGFRALFRVFDLDTGKPISEFDVGRDFSVRGLALSADGTKAAIVVRPRKEVEKNEPDLLIVDTKTSTVEKQFHTSAAGPIAFASPTTVRFLAWGKDMQSLFREVGVAQGVPVNELALGKEDASSGFAVSRDGKYFVTPVWRSNHVLLGELLLSADALEPDEAAVWDVATGRIIARVAPVDTPRLHLSANGRFLVVGSRIFELALPQNPSGDH